MNTVVLIRSLWVLTLVFMSSVFAQPTAREEVINAEYHFAETASASNTKEAFLTHLAPEGLIVRQGELVNGIQDWQKRQANNSLLSWYPSFVDAARSGDLGLSTGPWEWKKSRQDSAASAFGHFVSIWEKQPDGEWKVAIDIGVSHPTPNQKVSPLPKSGSSRISKPQSKKWSGAASKAELIELEKQLIGSYEKSGVTAFANYAAGDIRVYRPGAFPVVGKEAKNEILQETNEKRVFSVVGAEVAKSGDWGYVYGNVMITKKENDKPRDTKAAYMRVWKKNNQKKWEILLEVITL